MAQPAGQETGAISVPGYDVGEVLGSGGFGHVYRARHALIGRDVAIKVLHAKYSTDPEAIQRFVAEARAVNQISHPNIVEISDFGTLADGRQYCVMELIRGATLRDVLRAKGHLPLAEALPILRGIAEAVDAAHAHGIAHRDLKPDNVFVLDEGGVKLIDFGLAKLTHEEAAPVTQTGSVFGTPLYMSPEQCRGKPVTVATDAYSFGVLAYHVLVGEPPFSGDALELALHHLNDPPEPPSRRRSTLSSRVDRVVLALLEKDPAARPSRLVAAVDAIGGTEPLPARPRWRRRTWLALSLAGAAVAATVAVATRDRPAASVDPCEASAAELATVWNVHRRTAVQLRFVAAGRPDVDTTWRHLSTLLDTYTDQWQAQRVAACRAPDRTADPLLYAQRIACLDNGLVMLRGAVQPLLQDDVRAFADGYVGTLGLPDLADCQNTGTLRGQVPPPPAEKRAAIDALLAEYQRQRAAARAFFNGLANVDLDQALATFESIRAKLAALGSPLASEVAAWRAHYVLTRALQQPTREQLAAAKEAIDVAIEQATHDRNELMLVMAYERRAELAGGTNRPLSEIDDALTRAEEALARAGSPATVAHYLRVQRADYEERRGNLDKALSLLAATDERSRWILLARMGRADEAVALTRRWREDDARVYGRTHSIYINGLQAQMQALIFAGDLEGALAICREHAAAVASRDARRAIGVLLDQLDLELRIGRMDEARATYARIRGLGIRDIDIARFGNGPHLTTMRFALDQIGSGRPELDPSAADDGRALLEYMDGNYEQAVVHASRVPPTLMKDVFDDHWIVGGPVALGILAMSQARLGHRSAAEQLLPLLAKSADVASFDNGGAILGYGMALGALGRWAESRGALERLEAQAAAGWQDVVELMTWLGRARLELGDTDRARENLERALMAAARGSQDEHYTTPMAKLALARLLWDGNIDRVRARTLAEQARDAYAKRGVAKIDLAIAERWLAAHPKS